jgi:hypothetical protein
MKQRRFVCLWLCPFVLLLSPHSLIAQAPIAGTNVNMVSGTDWTNGDPFLERQNEPSIAVSTRNTLHLVGGANDYRTVDLPGLLGITEPGDAWLGLYKSFDGGTTWRSTLLPGYPLDTSAVGVASPIHGFQAAADPTVRSGTNGLIYYSGIAFNRGTNGLGAVFVATLIDNNNKENGNPTAESGAMTNLAPTDPIRYIRTVMVDSGTSGQFLDKPWLAVDVPRGSATCTVNYTNPDGSSGSQRIPAGRVLLAYSNFTGGSTSKINVIYSTDCGATFSKPIKISQTNNINQGTTIAIDPSTASNSQATVYVAWRLFNASGQPDAIMVGKSTDGGKTWGKAVAAITFPSTCPTAPTTAGCPFDQGDSGTTFRSNAYPAMAVDANGRVYIAVSQRQSDGDARIVMTVSADGVNWPNQPVPVDNGYVYADDGTAFSNLSGRGHQVMPSLAFSAGQLTLVYYDLREDHTIGSFTLKPDLSGYTEARTFEDELSGNPSNPEVFNSYADDSTLVTRRHTLDVMGTQAAPQSAGILTVPTFNNFRVSRYYYGINPNDSTGQVEQLQVNPPNLPMFVQGTNAFIGDYIDIAGAPPFILQNGTWNFNTSPTNPQFLFAAWTDNRNVVPPPDNNWTKYTPVYSASNPQGSTNISKFDPTQTVPTCNNAYAGTRNQDVYSARIDPGLVLSSPGNSKTLGYVPNTQTLILRAFPLFVRNNTTTPRTYLLTITNQPALSNGSPDPLGFASFQQSGGVVATLSADVPANSSVARSVFIQSANPTASVIVTAIDTTPGSLLNSTITFNPDPNAPQLIDPDSQFTGQNPSVLNAEAYSPVLQPPTVTSPFSNSLIQNPAIQNPAIQNPAIQNQASSAALNPAIQNPAIQNPAIQNPAIQNPAIQNTTLSDAVYNVTNNGNTSATYAIKLYGTNSMNATLQLILAKQYITNRQDTATGCQLGQQNDYQVFANIPNPVFTPAASLGNPDIFDSNTTNATLALAPGETGQVILRGNLSQSDMQTLIGNLTPVVVSHAAPGGVSQATLTLITQTLADGFSNTSYNQSITVLGGVGAVTWSITNGALPPGLTLNTTTGAITGTPTSTGDYTFTDQVTDSAPGTPNLVSKSYTIHVGVQLLFTATALPDAIIGIPYSASLPVSGGTGTLTDTLVSGTLPSGLTFNAGQISGVPDSTNIPGTMFSPNFQVQDSGNPPETVTGTLTLRALGQLSAGGSTTTLPNAIAGQAYNATLTAAGGTGNYTWSVTAGTLPSNLTLNGSTGQITGTATTAGSSSFTLTVQDQSNPSQSSSTSASLLVATPLVINISAGSIPDGVVGKPYSETLAATGGTGTLSWAVATGSALPAGLSLSSTGQITGTPTTAAPGGLTTNLVVTDSGKPPQTANASITIRIGAPLSITTAVLPDAVVGVPYSQTLTATGGIGTFTWSANVLPAGLTLSSTGVLSGTPTSSVTAASIAVQLTDTSNPPQLASKTLNLHIASPLAVLTVSLPDGVVGVAYSQTLAATGGTGTYIWSAQGALPAGLNLTATGVVVGTPTTATAGTSFTAVVTDAGSPPQSTSRLLNVRIGAPISITTTSLASATPGTTYTQTLTASGGLGTYSWSLAAGSGPLPAGLGLSTSGVISGTTSTIGTFPITVQVADTSNPQQSIAKAFSVVVNAAYIPVFTVQPSNSSPGSQITPSVKVKVTDSKGNLVRNAVCVITLAVNPSGATLSGSTTATTGNNGIAIFASQSINLTGTGYQMLVTVTSPTGGGSALSVPFNVR